MPLISLFSEKLEVVEETNDEESTGSPYDIPEKISEPLPDELENEDEKIIDIETCIENNQNYTKADPSQFTLLSVLGQGSFGKVYMVRKDTGYKEGEFFAMKVLRKASLKVRDRMRTKMERDILAAIRHPFIVQLHFAFQTEGKLFLVLDLVRGGDLFGRLSKDVMFTEEDVKFYLAEMAMALDHLHGCGVIYRDLKPENILLEADGHIKLTDFGLCKESILGEKRTYSFCGTIEYMSPEVITRKGHGPAADWWSFAVLAYEMLSGSLPFHSSNRRETMGLILKARLAMPQTFSPNAQKLMRLLFKRNPETRLGAKEGLKEIKAQPFFESIDFDALFRKELSPPFKPAIPKNIDSNFFSSNMVENKESPGIASAQAKLFKGFSFVAPLNDQPDEYKVKNCKASAEEILGYLPVRTSCVFNDYKISNIIGVGSYSTVYKGVNKANNQTYAIKVVDATKHDCKEEIDILLRYSEHPNIVTLRDCYFLEMKYHLVMEYLRGGDLLTRVNKIKSYSEKEAASFMKVFASTLAYLHEHGVVHRDLKPSNIMYSDESCKPDSLRITDFGFAKQIRAENGLLMTPCYTANYVAPEVLKKQGYDAACDIWSMGVILYVIISGTTPFMNHEEEDPNVILGRITHGQLNLSTGVWTKVTNEAKVLIGSMINLDPNQRPNATQILQNKWLENENILPDVRLQQESWKLKDAMKIMFNAFQAPLDAKPLTSINNSSMMKRRANKNNKT